MKTFEKNGKFYSRPTTEDEKRIISEMKARRFVETQIGRTSDGVQHEYAVTSAPSDFERFAKRFELVSFDCAGDLAGDVFAIEVGVSDTETERAFNGWSYKVRSGLLAGRPLNAMGQEMVGFLRNGSTRWDMARWIVKHFGQ